MISVPLEKLLEQLEGHDPATPVILRDPSQYETEPPAGYILAGAGDVRRRRGGDAVRRHQWMR